MEKRQLIRCTIKPVPGDRNGKTLKPTPAEGSHLSVTIPSFTPPHPSVGPFYWSSAEQHTTPSPTSAIDMTALRGPLRCPSTRRESNTSQYRGSMARSSYASADCTAVGKFCSPRPWPSSPSVILRVLPGRAFLGGLWGCSSRYHRGPHGIPFAIASNHRSRCCPREHYHRSPGRALWANPKTYVR